MVHLSYMNVLNEYFLHKQKNALVHIICYSCVEQQKPKIAVKCWEILLQV
jgi:hypothetical protein